MTPSDAPAENNDPDPVEAAKAEARAEAMREANASIARARIELEAARKGVDVSASLDFVNTAAFLAEDGSVNADAVSAFVSSVAPAKSESAFSQEVLKNAGVRNSEERAKDPYTPVSFKGMSVAQIEALVNSGRLDKLV